MLSSPWMMSLIGVVVGILLKWGFDFFFGNPRWNAENSSTGLAIQLEQVKRDAAARAESDSAKVARLEADLVKYKGQLDDLAAAKEVQDLKRVIAEKDKALEEQKFEFTKEHNHISSELERMTRERLKLEQQLSDLEFKSKGAMETAGKLTEREATIRTLQSALEKSKQELAEAKNSLAEGQSELSQLAALQAERDEFALQVANQETTINEMRSQHQTEAMEWDVERAQLQSELDTVRSSIESENQELVAQMTALRDEWTEREQALSDEVEEIASAHQTKVNDLESERAQLVKTRADLSQEVARLTQQLSVAYTNSSDGPTLDGESVVKPKMYLKAATRRDPLYQIKGIGPVFEQKFYSAGVTKFSELAGLSEDRIRDIIGVDAWQKVDGAGWVAEAAERSAGTA